MAAFLTITIPKKAAGAEELVAIPRKEYEELLRAKKSAQAVVKRSPSFRVPKKHAPFYDALDKELTGALRDYKKGNYHGPFETVEELRKSLES